MGRIDTRSRRPFHNLLAIAVYVDADAVDGNYAKISSLTVSTEPYGVNLVTASEVGPPMRAPGVGDVVAPALAHGENVIDFSDMHAVMVAIRGKLDRPSQFIHSPSSSGEAGNGIPIVPQRNNVIIMRLFVNEQANGVRRCYGVTASISIAPSTERAPGNPLMSLPVLKDQRAWRNW